MTVLETVEEKSPFIQEARRWVRYLPWLALVTGLAGAVMIERTPGLAWMVAIGCVIGWCVLFALSSVERNLRDTGGGVERAKPKRTRIAQVFGSQVAVQLALLFPLPFYVKAASVNIGHGLFFGCYAIVVVISLGTRLYEKVTGRGWSSFAINAFAVFVAVGMVLPLFGLSNHMSLILAGAVSAVSVPLLVFGGWRTPESVDAPKRKRRWIAFAGGLVVVAAARLGAPLVPPAPLHLASVDIGSLIENRELMDASPRHDVGTNLVCYAVIMAPLGLADVVVHVWRKDDEKIDELIPEFSGGRDAGFRFWSKRYAPLEGWPAGTYTCSVETGAGQILGEASVIVGPERPER